jgi:hypothetical protein
LAFWDNWVDYSKECSCFLSILRKWSVNEWIRSHSFRITMFPHSKSSRIS